MKTFAVIGSGGMGSLLAAWLSKTGVITHLLARSDYYAIKQNGLTIVSDDSKQTYTEINVHQSFSHIPACDVVVIAVKSQDNKHIVDKIAHLLKPDSIIFIIQNGIGVEDIFAKFYPQHKIISGVCWIKAIREKPGFIAHAGGKKIQFGEFSTVNQVMPISDVLIELAAVLEQAGFVAETTKRIADVRWTKLAVNLPIFATTIVLHTHSGAIANSVIALRLFQTMQHEITELANACGANVNQEEVAQSLQRMKNFTSRFVPSMKQDYDEGRTLELEYTFDYTVQLAKQKQITMPVLDTFYQSLLFLLEQRTAH